MDLGEELITLVGVPVWQLQSMWKNAVKWLDINLMAELEFVGHCERLIPSTELSRT